MTYHSQCRALAYLASFVVACGPGGSGSASGSGSDSDSDSGTGNDTDTASSTTGLGTDGSGSASSAGSSGGTTGCPTPEPVTASFSVTTNTGFSGGVDLPCTLDTVTPGPESTTVEATCGGGGPGRPPTTVTLTWSSTGHAQPLVQPGESVLLTYVTDPIFWVNEWFALKIAGEQAWLLAAGVSGSALDPPDRTLSELLEQPKITAGGAADCEPVKGECSAKERLRLDLEFDGTITPVVAPGTGYAGQLVSYRLVAEEAARMLPPIECTDIPGTWYDLVVESVPEG